LISIDDLFAFYDDFGYLGILLISFLGSIIVFVPIPFFPVLVTAAFNKNLDPHIIALSSAIGSVVAKLIIFYGSYYGRKILSSTTKKRMIPLQRLLSKYGWPGAFVAALTPIPDDIVYIPLGLAKYNPVKFAIATFAGKLILSEIIVWGSVFLGRPFIQSVVSETTDVPYLVAGAVLSIIVLGILIYISLKIDWAKIIGKWFPWTLQEENEDKDSETKKG
jgi:membrane protein DedA with SNARE-associated domain